MENETDIRTEFHSPIQTVSIPMNLFESTLGRYFTAETPHLFVRNRGSAWGALFNPRDSGVNLHVYVVTMNYVRGEPLTIGFYMNSELPGCPHEMEGFPTNTAIRPLPRPMISVRYASGVQGLPRGGQFMLSRTAYPGQLMMLKKNGMFIVPPGGNYCAFADTLICEQDESEIYLAFGWYEELV